MTEPYMTVKAFREETLIEVDKFNDDSVKKALLWASDLIDKMTGRDRLSMWFSGRPKQLYLDGRGHEYIQLPVPILELTSLKQRLRASSASSFVQGVAPEVLFNELDLTNIVHVEKWVLTRIDGQIFLPGDKNHFIEGTFGDYATPPETVIRCVLKLAKMRLNKEEVVKQGGLLPVGPSGLVKFPTMTGDAEVDAIIKQLTVQRQVNLGV